jgi:hypothetical protein
MQRFCGTRRARSNAKQLAAGYADMHRYCGGDWRPSPAVERSRRTMMLSRKHVTGWSVVRKLEAKWSLLIGTGAFLFRNRATSGTRAYGPIVDQVQEMGSTCWRYSRLFGDSVADRD